MNQNKRGYQFERYVEQLFKDLGYRNVKKGNIHYAKNIFGRRKRKCQIDIEYSRFLTRVYVECKYKSNGYVNLDEVKCFVQKLRLLRVPAQEGLMVTNQDYTPRAKRYARAFGLKLYNRRSVERLHNSRLGFAGLIRNRFSSKTLEQRVAAS